MSTLRQMTAEVVDLNTAKGWRNVINPWGDYVALFHTEVSEILENYRDRRLAAYTTATGKPDDVGSELADCLIRLLDMCDAHGFPVFDMDMELADVAPIDPAPEFELGGFGSWVAWLHDGATEMWLSRDYASPLMLRRLVAFCGRWNIDLAAEFERKMAYNWTRPYQHGGRTLTDEESVTRGGAT